MDTLNIKKKFKNSCLFLVAIRVLILIEMLGYSSASYSQIGTVYPMDINVMMTPPYSTCLYENVGNGRFQCNVLMRDMRGSNHPFKIKMVVKDAASGRAKFSAMSKIHTIQAGQVAYMANDNVLAEILDDPNAVKFMNNGCLPEGSYEFVFQLVDAKDSRNIPISKEFVLLARLNAGNAPLLFFPQNGDTIGRPLADGICSETVVNFSWNVGAANGNFNTYKFEITSVPEGANEEDVLNQKEVNLGYEESYVYMPMITLAQSTSRFSTHNTKYAWRVTICDEKRQPRTNYSNKGASEVFSFVYCGEPVQLEPYVPKTGPIVKAIADDLDPLEIDSIDTTNVSAKAFWRYNKDLISEKNYSGYIVEIVKCGLDTWTPNTISDPADTSFAFSNLKYNEKYCARAQYYIELGEGEKKYGPYGEIDTFLIPNPVDTVDCGELKGPGECEEGEEFQVVKKYGVIIANGTPVTVDSITSYSADSSEISGFGYVAFPILSNFKLRMNFENIKVNCRGELVKGKIHSVYDESRAAIIDLNHIFGKGEGGGAPSQTTETSMTSFDSEESAKKNTSVGDFAEVEGKIYVKAPDGSMVEVGSKLSLTADQYSSQDVLDNDKVFVVFHNDTEKHEYIAFDADENKVYRKVAVLASHYESFSKQAGNSNEYIVPWVASNPGRVVGLSATMEGAKFSDYNAVKFVTPLSGGDYLELKATLSGDKYLVDLPGKTPNTNTAVYVIAQKTSSDPFVNVGKIKIENYEYRNQKVKFVPVLKNYEVDKDAIAGYLNMVYGRFGITFTVDVEDPIESPRIETLVQEGFALKTEGLFAKESDAMVELQHQYRMIRDIEQMEDSTVYFFLLEKPSDYTGVAGDMPQNRNCGYIFMDGKSTLSDGRLVAHEIAHGVYNLDHIFEKAYGIKQGTTDNLLDYNEGNQLAQYQWNLIKEPGFAWALFEKDEDNFLPPCVYKAVINTLLGEAASRVVDAVVSEITGEQTPDKSLSDQAIDGALNFGSNLIDKCVKNARLIKELFDGGVGMYQCLRDGNSTDECLCKTVVKFAIHEIVEQSSKLFEKSDKFKKFMNAQKADVDKKRKEIVAKFVDKMKLPANLVDPLDLAVKGASGALVDASIAKMEDEFADKVCQNEKGSENISPLIGNIFVSASKCFSEDYTIVNVISYLSPITRCSYQKFNVQDDPVIFSDIPTQVENDWDYNDDDLHLVKIEDVTGYMKGVGGTNGLSTGVVTGAEVKIGNSYTYQFRINSVEDDVVKSISNKSVVFYIEAEGVYAKNNNEVDKDQTFVLYPCPTPPPTVTYTEKDDCSDSDLFKRTANTRPAAKAAANQARIEKGECVYGIPKCSKWLKDDHDEKIIHIKSPTKCDENSEEIENLFTITLEKAGDVSKARSRVLNQEVAKQNLYKVFTYEKCANKEVCDSMLVLENGVARMIAADEYFLNYAFNIFIKASYDWVLLNFRGVNEAKFNISFLKESLSHLKELWEMDSNDNTSWNQNSQYQALNSNSANGYKNMHISGNKKRVTELQKELKQLTIYDSFKAALKKNLHAENNTIDLCDICASISAVYGIVARTLASISYPLANETERYTLPCSNKYIFDGLLVNETMEVGRVYTNDEGIEVVYSKQDAENENKVRIASVENGLSIVLGIIADGAKMICGDGTHHVFGCRLKYTPDSPDIVTLPNIAVKIKGDSCH